MSIRRFFLLFGESQHEGMCDALTGRLRSTGAVVAAICIAVALARVAAAQTPAPIPGFVRCDIPIGAPGSAIAAGNFDSSGNQDLAVVDGKDSQVVVLLTDRNRFAVGDCVNATRSSNVSVSGGPTSIAAADLDLNRTIDLVVGVQQGVSILRGNGSGTFTPENPLGAGVDPQAVAVSDVDGDGVPDIVVGNGNGNSVSILYGKRDGTYEHFVSLPVDGAVTFMVVQDLNRDSFVDIAAGSSMGTVTVFIQDRNNPRSFTQSPSFAVGTAPTAMAAGDFNGDGAPDLLVTSGGNSGVVTLFLNQLPGNVTEPFVQETVVPTGLFPSALGVDDFNSDFALDVVVANQGDQTLPFFLGNDNGGLQEGSGNCRGNEGGRCTVGAGPLALVLADVDGDGQSDVITANQSAGSISVLLSSRPPPTPTPTASSTRTVTPTATATSTVTATATPTATPTATASASATRTAQSTLTPTITSTPTAQCFGSVCVAGQGCLTVAPENTGPSGLWLLAPALLWLVRRRGRRA